MPSDHAHPARRDLTSGLQLRLNALLDGTSQQLGRPAPLRLSGFDPALTAIDDVLDDGLARLPGLERQAESELLAMRINALRELREDIRGERFRQRVNGYDSVNAGIDVLHGLVDADQLMAAVCSEACRSCSFERVLLSRVEGSQWIPHRVHVRGDPRDIAGLMAGLRGETIRLRATLAETTMLRRQEPIIVLDPIGNAATHGPIVDVSRTSSYVAAPIRSDGRVIGFLHGDHCMSRRRVDTLDRDVLSAFAEAFGPLVDRSVLQSRLDGQRVVIHAGLKRVESMLDELASTGVGLPRTPTPEIAARSAEVPVPATLMATTLTRREQEVLELMATGASNRAIAETLYLSTGTVKGHVRRLFSKLGFVNRAEAVAWYLRGALIDPSGRPAEVDARSRPSGGADRPSEGWKSGHRRIR